MLRLLTDPDAFFAARREDAGWLGPLAIVLAAALVGVLAAVPVLRATLANLPATAGPVRVLVAVAGAVGGLLGTVVVWLVYAVVFYVLSVAFGGEGSFGLTTKFVGWGFLPAVASGLVGGVANFVVFADAQFPSDPAAIGPYVQSLRDDPVFLAAGVISVLLTLYQGYLWTYAVKHARGLDLREAAVTVGIPVGLSVLWQAFNVV